MSDATNDDPKPLTFPEALKLKQEREAHGHGTSGPDEVLDEQLATAAEVTAEREDDGRAAHDSGEDHDHTTNVPR